MLREKISYAQMTLKVNLFQTSEGELPDSVAEEGTLSAKPTCNNWSQNQCLPIENYV